MKTKQQQKIISRLFTFGRKEIKIKKKLKCVLKHLKEIIIIIIC